MAEPEDHSGFGTEGLPANGEDRPLVTFALFAYNQEDYIREAVEGAFAQTYSPLEIILSDDCSSDRTFEIMQEMAAAYQGPHRLVLRRNPQNLGLIDHCNTICEQVQSEFIVLAAGDDVSYPHRVAVSIEKLEGDANAMLVHSSATAIDQAGMIIGLLPPPVIQDNVDPAALALSESIYIGATAAFKIKLFRNFGRIEELNTYEDLIFGFRAALLNGLRYIESPIIKYRVGVGVSFEADSKKLSVRERRILAISRKSSTMKQRQRDFSKLAPPKSKEVEQSIKGGVWRWSAKEALYCDKIAFLRGFFTERANAHVRAIASELKFHIGLIG